MEHFPDASEHQSVVDSTNYIITNTQSSPLRIQPNYNSITRVVAAAADLYMQNHYMT